MFIVDIICTKKGKSIKRFFQLQYNRTGGCTASTSQELTTQKIINRYIYRGYNVSLFWDGNLWACWYI